MRYKIEPNKNYGTLKENLIVLQFMTYAIPIFLFDMDSRGWYSMFA